MMINNTDGGSEMKTTPNPNQYKFKIGPSEFYTMLVKGGWTGKKLHAGNSGSSASGCGHWTKTHLKHFEVANNIRPETLKKFHDAGSEMCEKCFPQFAVEDKAPKYRGPKRHLPLARDFYMAEGKIKFKRRMGSACRRDNAWDIMKISEFRTLSKETPEACCSACLKSLPSYDEQIKAAQNRQ
jgi:hypothetical protein